MRSRRDPEALALNALGVGTALLRTYPRLAPIKVWIGGRREPGDTVALEPRGPIALKGKDQPAELFAARTPAASERKAAVG